MGIVFAVTGALLATTALVLAFRQWLSPRRLWQRNLGPFAFVAAFASFCSFALAFGA